MTYSIVARDPQSGALGVASQSHYFAVGRVVTFARAGVGAVATQSFVDPSYGPRGLDLMESGIGAADALGTLVAGDVEAELRQVAMVDTSGGTAAHTGARCVARRGDHADDQFVALGNMLASDAVVPAMAAAFAAATGDLADRLLAAMDAAEAAGGDARGRMSASLIVVSGEPAADPWAGRLIDVRVDDAEDPLAELRRLVTLSRAHRVFGQAVFTPGLLSADSPTVGEALDAALSALDDAAAAIGPDPEPELWKGVLLARAGRSREAGTCLRAAVERRSTYRDYLDGLHAVGILPVPGRKALGDD